MPIRIGDLRRACFVQFRDLRSTERKACRREVIAELLFIACANDHAGNGRLSQQPVQSDLGNALAINKVEAPFPQPTSATVPPASSFSLTPFNAGIQELTRFAA